MRIAATCAGVVLAQVEIASAADPEPTATALEVLKKFDGDGVFVRSLALKTDSIKFEPCNLHVPFTAETYSLYKATKSSTWLGKSLPQTPYEFNENNKTIDLFGTSDTPKWNPVLMLLDRDKTLAHAVQFYDGDANTNVNNFQSEDWSQAQAGCWSKPLEVLRCNGYKLDELINRIKLFYFEPKGLVRKAEKYNEVRLFNYDPSGIMGFIIEDRQCTKTADLTCDLKKEHLARLQTVVNAFWHGPKPSTANPCPAPTGKLHGYGADTPITGYSATYKTMAGSSAREFPVFRIEYGERKTIDGMEKPTIMVLRYVTTIRPGPVTDAIDLSALARDKDL